MKYYCPECKSEYEIGETTDTCGYCTMLNENDGEECGEILIKLPNFETPSQYEKRTGKKWNGAVWYKFKHEDTGVYSIWYANTLSSVSRRYKYVIILCANSPESPPDDYMPETES